MTNSTAEILSTNINRESQEEKVYRRSKLKILTLIWCCVRLNSWMKGFYSGSTIQIDRIFFYFFIWYVEWEMHIDRKDLMFQNYQFVWMRNPCSFIFPIRTLYFSPVENACSIVLYWRLNIFKEKSEIRSIWYVVFGVETNFSITDFSEQKEIFLSETVEFRTTWNI